VGVEGRVAAALGEAAAAESAEAEGAGAAWAALSPGAAGVAPLTALSPDWVAVSARRSPPQAASSATTVSVTDSILVIVISPWCCGFPAGPGGTFQNRLGPLHPVVTPVTTGMA
jgi:hypothetical protein